MIIGYVSKKEREKKRIKAENQPPDSSLILNALYSQCHSGVLDA
jgi:hypothetical protein